MLDERRQRGALWRAFFGFILLLGCAAAPADADSLHHHAVAHHHRHRVKLHHHRIARLSVTAADFERALAAAKPVITIPASGAAPEIVVFGRIIDEPSSGIGLLADMGTTVDFGLERTSASAGAVYEKVANAARVVGAPVALALAVTRLESGGSCGKIGSVGERGPMQIRPQTAWAIGLRPHSCADWIDASVRYLKIAVAMHGDGCGGASAYNLGTYTRGTFCTGYGRAILALARGAPTLRAALWEAHWSPSVHIRYRHHHSAHAWTSLSSRVSSPG